MIRELRNARRMSMRGLADRTFVSHSTVQRWENGERPPKDRTAAELIDRQLGAGGLVVDLWQEIGRAVSAPTHVSDSIDYVSDTSIDLAMAASQRATSDDEGTFVPARLRDGSVVFVALDRRAMLRGGMGLSAAAALGGGTPAAASPLSSLTRPAQSASAYSSTPVEHFQRARRLLIDSDNLLGPSRAIAAARQHIQDIKDLRQDAKGSDRHALMELQTQYAEFASWLYQDLGDFDNAQFWLDRAFQWSHTVGDGDLTSYVMARKAQLAGEVRDLVDVVDLAEAAQRMARPRSRLAAVARTYEAYGHALRGESTDSERAIDDVRNALDRVSGDTTPWGVWLNEQYVEVHRAQGLEVLGKHAEAAEVFTSAIKALPDGYHRDRGVYMARAAVAHAGAGAPDQAAAVGLQALTVANDTGSGRIIRELARLDKVLVPWQRQPEVAEFRAHFDGTLAHES
ncbi:helix-turn-helix domain-containing protein [Streptomyces sp. SID335]|nr:MULTISPECIES: helix-turn-helix transcriptional regulator [unclassified Streptomyces]NEA05841.1 helix-turn-helix transcriptional regulator [Streptomyces sp. SID10116]MYY80866.1 helix-turn-helix domain-containing protein [Streptomyces sp. SID335]MYZ13313.1 helix-turn-helix domain-containing protein [Streptomyces sp. SID337]NDZ85676.1 helix-turn-helix transcriptional regulator [Streptomyces sp. SID10115]NEB49992.1 helix-turn-helix transcriptional regulator [Streptomyces sp. SID339]